MRWIVEIEITIEAESMEEALWDVAQELDTLGDNLTIDAREAPEEDEDE